MGNNDPLKVLVIEDNIAFSKSLSLILRTRVNAQTDCAYDATTAREKLSAGSYDLVTLDYRLPDGDGLDILSEINSYDTPPRVIMVTGNGDEGVAIEAFGRGASGYVVKDRRMGRLLVDAVRHASLERSFKGVTSALEASDRRYRQMFRNMNEGVALCELVRDEEGAPVDYRILDINEELSRILGIEREKVIGLPGSSPEIGEWPELATFVQVVQDGKPVKFEHTDRSRAKYLKASVFPADGDRFVAIFMDVSGQRMAQEELKRINTELRSYDSTVAHDLKGPLAAISVGVAMLRELFSTDPAAEQVDLLLDILTENSQKAQERIDRLLMLAESAERIIDVEEIDIRALVEEILIPLESEIDASGISISIEEELGIIRANRQHLQQVFSNLIMNAIRHCEAPEPAMRISRIAEEDGVHVLLIRDNGAGIPEDELDTLFTPFNKGAASDGSGVGLSIARRIAYAYGGDIRAYNDNGACFEITLQNAKE